MNEKVELIAKALASFDFASGDAPKAWIEQEWRGWIPEAERVLKTLDIAEKAQRVEEKKR